MLRVVEALNFRCLRYIDCHLDRFHVLVGPNGSGKTTFFETIAMLSDLLNLGLEETLGKRSPNALDLTWKREGRSFELAVEADIPDRYRGQLEDPAYVRVRYEVSIGRNNGEDAILYERVLLLKQERIRKPAAQPDLFPMALPAPETLRSPRKHEGMKTVVNKVPGGNDNFYDETGRGWDHAFKLGPTKSALANLPGDETKFPVSSWLKGLLSGGVEALALNSILMRKASPPGGSKKFRTDGSNLPWVVAYLEQKHPDRLREWTRHLRTAIPDLASIRTVEREEDKHRYLFLQFDGGMEVPSWLVSDGTLRLMALTLPAYLPEFHGIYLIEEPENGIHPRAVETLYKSLSSVPEAQILVATHSAVILSIAKPEQVLCFGKTPEGQTAIVRGSEHPRLRDWRGTPNLGVLYAGGVLD